MPRRLLAQKMIGRGLLVTQLPITTENPDIETCEHGMMILKEGKSKTTGLAYYGYTCPAPVVHLQCPPRWYKLGADGKWMPKNG
jgi:hypothetical protein